MPYLMKQLIVGGLFVLGFCLAASDHAEYPVLQSGIGIACWFGVLVLCWKWEIGGK